MEWKIEHLEDVGIIKTTVSGSVTIEEIEVLTVEQISLAKQFQVNRFLSVYGDASIKTSIADIHNLPHILREIGQSNTDKFAIVYSHGSIYASEFEFFETRCFNTMLNNSKVFKDYDTAYQWLLT